MIANVTTGFSGADLTEICQKAAKAAVRDVINHLIQVDYRIIRYAVINSQGR